MNDKPYLQKGWLTGQAKLIEAIDANERAIKQQSELYALSFDQLMKELT